MGEARRRKAAIQRRVKDMLLKAGSVDVNNPEVIRKLVEEELFGVIAEGKALAKRHGVTFDIAKPHALGDAAIEGALIAFNMGSRDDLSDMAAKKAADGWRKLMTRIEAVRGIVVFLAGWDHDPRALGDIPEAADYVRRWARFASITLPSTMALVTAGKLQPDTLGLLAACGVFGEDIRRDVIVRRWPSPGH